MPNMAQKLLGVDAANLCPLLALIGVDLELATRPNKHLQLHQVRRVKQFVGINVILLLGTAGVRFPILFWSTR